VLLPVKLVDPFSLARLKVRRTFLVVGSEDAEAQAIPVWQRLSSIK
jgi:hypothetical protein